MAQGSSAGAGRSTAIVLFTDLVGSSELRSRLGEDAAEELRRKHDRLVTEAIEANGGRLVKNLGDGVMATFTGAGDGVAAAERIQQSLERHNRSGGSTAALEVRIGLSAGDVAFEDDDCFGTPVIEAARLCAAARGGQVLITDVVRLLAGSAGGHQFEPVGALDLKGLPAPVATCEVIWESAPRSSVPLPALLTDVGRIFVGREEQLERLEQLWKEALAGERRVALVAGEPGVGKTRLAAELATSVHAEGAVVLAGRCDEDLGVPYQPFVESLRQFVDHTPPEELPRRLGRYGGELARLVPELAEHVCDLPPPLRSDPETERYRLFDAVASWLAGVSAETPILVILDDLQWAAKPTLLLLRHVMRYPEPARLLVVGTYRDSDIHRGHPLTDLLGDLRRGGGATRLPLVGLDASAVTAFVQAAAGHELDEEGLDLARAVWAETEGNPFFVVEVLRHLSESGALERREGRWTASPVLDELGIPEGVRDVVSRRLSRLSESANQALALAAVAGVEFELAVVAVAGGLAEDDVIAGVEEAVAARLVVELPGPVPRNRFSHALVRATLYDELSAGRRVALHRKVAEAIETLHAHHLDDYLPALTHHWGRASTAAATPEKAIEYATRAGDRALAQLAHDEAVAYYHQALELLDVAGGGTEEARRQELLIALGGAQGRAGDAAYRQTLLDAAGLAGARGDADALARAALANSRGALWSATGTVDTDRVAVLEAALSAVGERDTAVRARLLANLALELIWAGDRGRRLRLSDEALAIARRLDDPATFAHVLVNRAYAISAPATLAERLGNSAELLALSQRLGDPVIESRAWSVRFRAAMEAGDVEEADRCLAACERLGSELRQPAAQWVAGMHRTGRTLLAGRVDEAEQLALATVELGRTAGQPDAPTLFAWQRIVIRFEQGRLHEVTGELTDLVSRFPRLVLLWPLLALVWSELEQHEKAWDAYERVATSGFAVLPVDSTWLRGVTDSAAVCAHLRDRDRAAVLRELITPYADQVPVGGLGVASGSVSHYLGLLATTLGRFDEAEACFAAAETAHERMGAPTWLARTRLEWARMLRTLRPREPERARKLLGQALSTARELGLANVERRAAELLTSL